MTRTTLVALALLAATGRVEAAGFNCEKFQHNPDGTWRALEPVEIYGPNGRLDFTPDETYKLGQMKQGLDLAKLLDANCAKK